MLSQACTDAAEALAALADQRLLEGDEADHFADMCRVFSEHLLPFASDCFGAIYRDPSGKKGGRRREWLQLVRARQLTTGLKGMAM